jgi:hypothetical protein
MILQNTKPYKPYKYSAFNRSILLSAWSAFMVFSPISSVGAESLAYTIGQNAKDQPQTSSESRVKIEPTETNQTTKEEIHHNQRRISRPAISTDTVRPLSADAEEIKRTSTNSFALSGRTDVLLGGSRIEGSQSMSPQSAQTADIDNRTLRGKSTELLSAQPCFGDNVGLMRGWVSTNHPEAIALFAKLSPDAIVNVLGHADHEEQNEDLQKLGLNFVSMTRRKFKNADLANCKVVIMNCDGPKYFQKGDLRLLNFIRDGGCLIETDWAATDWLCVHFSTQFKASLCLSGPILAKVNLTAPGVPPELTKGCAPTGPWLMEPGLSWCRIFNATSEVSPIPLASGNASSEHVVPAFYLQCGKGMILHLAGHYDPRFTDAVPSMGISIRQGLLLNFLIFSLEAQQTKPNLSIPENLKDPLRTQ